MQLTSKNLINQQSIGCTALIIAAQRGHLKIAELFLDRHANVNAQNKYARWFILVMD